MNKILQQMIALIISAVIVLALTPAILSDNPAHMFPVCMLISLCLGVHLTLKFQELCRALQASRMAASREKRSS